MAEPADEEFALRTIPLFPLVTPTLFPAVRVPFFIFEPRYRQMTEAALAGERVIGMCTVVPSGRAAMAGDPPIYPVGCMGSLEAARQRPDGTWDIALEGVTRFEIVTERDRAGDRLFREARVRILHEAPPASGDEAEVTRLRAEVHRRYGEVLAQLAPQHVEAFRSQDFEAIPDDVYANTVSLSLDIDPAEKQSLLESSGVHARLARVLTVLEFKLAESQTSDSTNPKTLQ